MNYNSKFEDESKTTTVGSSLIEFLTTVVKYRKFLFLFVFIITLSATAYALLSPKWYKSVASVFPAERTDFMGSLAGLSSLAKNLSASRSISALTGGGESDKYVAILQSTTIRNNVIEKYDLRKVYDMEDDYYENLVKEYESNIEIEIEDEGNITLTVYDKDPQRAADMANYMIDKLNEINTQLSITNAKANREFIEHRYIQNISDIDSLETAMKIFQTDYGIISMPEQIESSIKAMTEIYATLAEREIQFNVLKRTYSEDHPLVKNTQIEIEEIYNKINNISAGTDISQKDINLIIPFKKAPELGNEYIKIYRNLEVQYKILEFITPLYEQAKVEEVRNTPSVLVLDKAFPADRKAKPKGSLYALLSFVISTTIALIIVMILEWMNRLKVHDPKRYSIIFDTLKADLKKFGLIR